MVRYRLYRNLVVPVIFLLINSCEFSPSGEFFRDIEEVSTDDISVELLSPNDTTELFLPTTLLIDLDLGSKLILDVRASINNRTDAIEGLFFNSEDGQVFATILPKVLGTGMYDLKLDVATTLGNGSIADTLRAETLNFEFFVRLIVNVDPPPAPVIESITEDNGILFIQWNKYTNSNFQSFTLRKLKPFQNQSGDMELELYDQWNIPYEGVNQFHDTDFIDGQFYYQVVLNAADTFSTSEAKSFSYEFTPQISTSLINDSSIAISWNSPLFTSQFTNYSVLVQSRSEPHLISNEIRYDISDIDDTIRVFNPADGLRHGLDYLIELRVSFNRLSDRVVQSDPVRLETNFFQFQRVLHNQDLEKLFFLTDDGITEVDYNTLEITNELDLSQQELRDMIISRDGTYGYAINRRGELISFDPRNNLEQGSTLRPYLYIPGAREIGGTRPIFGFQISNNNVLSGIYFDRGFVFDLDNLGPNGLIESSKQANLSISSDGNFVLGRKGLGDQFLTFCQKISGEYQPIDIVSDPFPGPTVPGSTAEARINELENVMLLSNKSVLSKYSISPFINEQEITFENGLNMRRLSIDRSINTIGYQNDDSYLVYDFETFVQIKSIPVRSDEVYFFFGNSLFEATTGRVIEVQ